MQVPRSLISLISLYAMTDDVSKMPEVDWRTSECVVGTGASRFFTGRDDWDFPLVFSNTSDILFRKAQYLLSLDKGRPYASIRWERFEYASVCKTYWADKEHANTYRNQLQLTCGGGKYTRTSFTFVCIFISLRVIRMMLTI